MKTQITEQQTTNGSLAKSLKFRLGAAKLVAALAVALLLPVAALADARVDSWLERYDISGNAAVLDFSQLGPAGTPVESGDSVDKGYDLTTLKMKIFFEGIAGGQVRRQGNDWAGNFGSGDFLLWTNSPGHGYRAEFRGFGGAYRGHDLYPLYRVSFTAVCSG